MAKFQVTISREVTEVTTLELDVKASDVKTWLSDSFPLLTHLGRDWKDHVDNYIGHQVDLTEAALQSNVDIESQSETEWEVVEAIE